jgi:hypothetical protein
MLEQIRNRTIHEIYDQSMKENATAERRSSVVDNNGTISSVSVCRASTDILFMFGQGHR